MISRIFWTLFAIEAGGFLILAYYILEDLRNKRWGPEGPVGGFLIAGAFAIFLFVGALGYFTNSPAVKVVGIVILAAPLVQMALAPLQSALVKIRADRSYAGDYTFRERAQRDLAHAIAAHDIATVKRLIPGAGNLNQLYEGETLLWFGLVKADLQDPKFETASLDAVNELLAAGADPNVPVHESSWPLTLAINYGPPFTQALLNAGANPNQLDGAGRPIWWEAIPNETEAGLATLRMLLGHGADVTKRDSETGPVGWAAQHKSWRAMWLLMEQGAAVENEQVFGQSVVSLLTDDLTFREQTHMDIPVEMRKAAAKLTQNRAHH